jgi:hypothetical protein
MGVSLTYTTTAPVGAAVRKAVEADAKRLNGGRAWWCEGFAFFKHRKRPAHLTGDTKLFFAGVFSDDDDEDGGLVEVHDDDDQFMGFRDAAFVVRQLCHWSAEHGIDWALEMAGADVGTVTGGAVAPAGLFGSDKPETKTAAAKATRLDKKYAARWG